MRQRLAELIAYMDDTRSRLEVTARRISPSFAGIRPRGDTWSAEDNMAHLVVVEAGVSRLIGRSVEWAKANGVGSEIADDSIMASLDRYGLAEGTFKMQAPLSVVPPEGKSIDESLNALTASRVAMKEALLSGDGLDLSQVKRPHPVAGEINVYQWALFVAQHEERHRRQIEKTLDEVTELAAESAPIV
ncbi:MAG: DinB family protein [Gemmatimonadaceae bacterium]